MRTQSNPRALIPMFVVVVATLAVGVWLGLQREGPEETSRSLVRAERRLYDGAPPVIPHIEMGASCTACHNAEGIDVPDLGFAPPSPHELTMGMSATSRCRQCHVYRRTEDQFRATDFVAFRQDLRKGQRHNPLAPPVIPHQISMRENCQACHSGNAAREEIRCSHPERERCQQCHATAVTRSEFERSTYPN